MDQYIAPTFDADGFHCPKCGVYAHQAWFPALRVQFNRPIVVPDVKIAFCARCKDFSLWYSENMIHPAGGTAPLPHPDIPDDPKADYEEARSIVGRSARGAAALLRLVVQKLCKEIGGGGKDINADIGNLVKKGLPIGVQQALDVVRVVGNNAVHPGQIDLRDNPQIAGALFQLVNIIAEKMISEPARLKSLFEALPDGQKAQIARRDG